MRNLLVAMVMVAACGNESTTPLGVTVRGDSPYSHEDIDAAFKAATIEPLDVYSDDGWTLLSSMTFSIDRMQAFGFPTVEFSATKVDCPADFIDEDVGLGCYWPDAMEMKIHVNATPGDEGCLGFQTDIAHFVAHYVQQVYGYPIDHGPPMWPNNGRAALVTLIQRHLFEATCR